MALLNDKKSIRWAVLLLLALPMFASYYFDDQFTTLSHLFKTPELLDLAWTSAEYGTYGGAYSLLCVFGGLVICGMLLDKWGVRITGTLFVSLMFAGACLVLYGISARFNQGAAAAWLGRFFPKPSLAVAYAGCALFGLGSEIAGTSVTRSIAKWFKGKEMALAMGLQLAIARLGTAAALVTIPRLVNLNLDHLPYAETAKPATVGVILLACGLAVWILFLAFDRKFDRQRAQQAQAALSPSPAAQSPSPAQIPTQAQEQEQAPHKPQEDKFRFTDLFRILGNRNFILVALLCVFFYCCVISFRRFATSVVIPRFGLDDQVAAWMVAMIPFCTVVFTPLFGVLVDYLGKATRLMILGSCLVLSSHLLLAFAPGLPFLGYVGIGLLGIGYSLVPAALWPSVPKIIPEKNLGTAYSLLYWFQNMGLLLVPILAGKIIQAHGDRPITAAVRVEYLFIVLALMAIGVALGLRRLSARHPALELDLPNKKKPGA